MTNFTPVPAAVGGLLIGVAAILLMATTGRIAGVSGFVSRLLPPYEDNHLLGRLAFVAGLAMAPFLYVATSGEPIVTEVTSNLGLLGAAGLLVGFGAVFGGGCTSGHGVCGTARLSIRSLVATLVFMMAAIATLYLSRHVLGGA